MFRENSVLGIRTERVRGGRGSKGVSVVERVGED